LSSAQLFQLKINKVFEPAGEECGTEYNEGTACPFCGTGADQVSPLFLLCSAPAEFGVLI
jgi:hypothetical protein